MKPIAGRSDTCTVRCAMPRVSVVRRAATMPRQLVAHSQRSERVGWPSGRRTQLDCRAYVAPPEKAEVKEEKKFNIVADVPSQPGGKQRVVVLGSGWGAASFVKALTKHASSKYEVILISPRNYFLYTPLLPAVATGTMEERSIVEPIRNMIVDKGDYYEAIAQDIDVKNKSLVCCFPADRGFREACFRVSYDMLVLAVGSVNNTFGIQGVEQHAFFFKSINDANRLRRQVSECFERAALPQTPPEERKQLLSFVVVGGGPTGVEVAAELYDMITDDLKRLYPKLMPDVNIYLIELMDHILSAYDRAISDYTAKHFRRNGIQLVLNSRVQSVSEGCVDVVDKDKNTSSIKFGACVWATGVAMNPLNKKLQEQIPGQTHFRSIITDRYLRVNGSDGSIFAIGDAATIEQNRALEYADKLFHKADVNGDGVLSVEEVRDALTKASKEFPQFNEHARFLEGKYGPKRFGGLVGDFMKQQKVPTDAIADDFSELTGEECLDEDSWRELIAKIDSGLRGLPATAQVARQEGEYLASIFDKHSIVAGMDFEGKVAPFEYNHKGALAYVGQDRAVMDVPDVGPLWGYGPGLAWKGFETISQFSFRNFCLVALDWTRTKVFGRDISRV